MMQSTASLGVVEESKRLTLHSHWLNWNKFKPEMLESLSAYEFWCTRLCHIVDSVFCTQIPPAIHVKIAACYEVGKLQKIRLSREAPCGNILDQLNPEINETNGRYNIHQIKEAILHTGDKVTSMTSIHGHMIPSCLPKGQTMASLSRETNELKSKCRFGYGSRLSSTTKFIQLSVDPNRDNVNDIIIGRCIYIG